MNVFSCIPSEDLGMLVPFLSWGPSVSGIPPFKGHLGESASPKRQTGPKYNPNRGGTDLCQRDCCASALFLCAIFMCFRHFWLVSCLRVSNLARLTAPGKASCPWPQCLQESQRVSPWIGRRECRGVKELNSPSHSLPFLVLFQVPATWLVVRPVGSAGEGSGMKWVTRWFWLLHASTLEAPQPVKCQS